MSRTYPSRAIESAPEDNMKLYFIHCGFYDEEISDGIYEFHVNIPIAAESIEEAKRKVRCAPQFISKKMHIDGIQEVESVEGYSVQVAKAATSDEPGVLYPASGLVSS